MSDDRVRRSAELILGFVAVAGPVRRGGAQVAPHIERAAASDSMLWQRVRDGAVQRLIDLKWPIKADSGLQPWIIRIAASEPIRSRLEARFTSLLHARPATADEPVVYTLELGPVRMLDDTAFVAMLTRASHACGNGTAARRGISDREYLRVPRGRDGTWQVVLPVDKVSSGFAACPPAKPDTLAALGSRANRAATRTRSESVSADATDLFRGD